MREIKLFVGQLSLYIQSGVKFAIATVVNVDGSAYRRPGARMLINENGDWHGGISGGCLEGDMLKKAQLSMLTNQNKLVKYDTREDDPFELGVGLGCNGLIEILISPDLEYARCLFEMLNRHIQGSKPTILEHTFYLNSKKSAFVTINSTNPFVSALPKEDLDEVVKQHQSKVRLLENQILFVEYLSAIPRIVIYGNLFDSSSLIELCHFLSWDVCWVGNPLKMSASLKNNVQSYFHWDDEFVHKNNDVIVLMTHDFERDVSIVKHLISINFKGYIGILGPLKRMQKIIKQLEILSVNINDMLFFGPIGLDIGAEGPNEIALSIVSEIIAFNNSRDGISLKNRIKSIHTN